MKLYSIRCNILNALILLCFCGLDFSNTTIYAANPVTKIGSKIVQKTAAKSLSRAAVRKSGSIIARNESRKAITKKLAKQEIKSFYAYSKKKSKLILRSKRETLRSEALMKSFKKTPVKKYKRVKHASLKRNHTKYFATNRGIRTLASGKKSLRVRWDERMKKYVPEEPIKSGNLDFDRKILSERRKAISPYNQFATSEQIANYNATDMEFGKTGSGEVLKRNMFRAMEHDNQKIAEGFGGFQAHHVVPKDMKEAKVARDILKKYNIDINSPENGIFLPQDANSIYKGIIHNTSHDGIYCKKVNQALRDCKSKEEVLKALETLKYDLYNGKLTLKDKVKTMNSNF